jgi:hypothetical protein
MKTIMIRSTIQLDYEDKNYAGDVRGSQDVSSCIELLVTVLVSTYPLQF